MLRFRVFKIAVLLTAFAGEVLAQDNKKVLLQGFWWDFDNNNYPQGWANYLVDLAPRLRKIGIEGVWVPVNQKNANPNSVGYSPFDHYDLGDKYQKSNLKTPFGDKDEYLRMVAILHANGMDVIQDVVLNHMDGAGSSTNAGGVDSSGIAFYNTNRPLSNYQDIPIDPSLGNKNFRYVSFLSPASSESSSNYLKRSGRWPKNWQNFNPGPGDNRFTGDDLSRTSFGPDIAYYQNSKGQSSISTFNPNQGDNYMRNSARDWLIWLKKQTGIDGFRLDAIKHFPNAVTEDFLWNLQNNAGFASGTNQMFAVGEWVGGKSELDAWVDAVQGRAGTFDFGLRGFSGTPGIYGLVYGLGAYDMSNLPGIQQDRRYRTVTFVNNHDTFRPGLPSSGSSGLQTNGNYPVNTDGSPKRWSSISELSPNIDPREARLTAAYAVIMAMDGHPTIFFEDLFDVGTTGMRYSHLPESETDLPVRQSIANLVRCHHKLDFKGGAYKVRTAEPSVFFDGSNAQELIVFERSGKAIIAITDNFTSTQAAWIDTDFSVGTILKDYTGNFPDVTVVTRMNGPGGRVRVQAPGCIGTSNNTLKKGVAVFGLASLQTFFNAPFEVSDRSTSHEWELADDLGDSHAKSLRQSGSLPANSTALRNAGKVYALAGKSISYKLISSFDRNLTLLLTDQCGIVLDSVRGIGNLSKTFTPSQTGWYQFSAKNSLDTNQEQRVWIRVNYFAPDSSDALATRSRLRPFADLGPDRYGCNGFVLYLNPKFIDSGISYVWKDGQGNQIGFGNTQPVSQAGTYSVTISNSQTGCSSSDAVTIFSFQDSPPAPFIQRFGDTLRIMNPLPGLRYSWRLNGSSNPADTLLYVLLPANSTSANLTTLNQFGCQNVTANLLTGVRSLLAENDDIQVSPNPASGIISVKISESLQGQFFSIIDPMGRNLRNGFLKSIQQEISLEHLSPGIYYLKAGHAVKRFEIK